jgi:hypothetical protein
MLCVDMIQERFNIRKFTNDKIYLKNIHIMKKKESRYRHERFIRYLFLIF